MPARRFEADPQNIVILRALQLGDLLCAVPAFRALRAALPYAKITLLGLPWAKWFVERFNTYLDELILLPGFPSFPEQLPDVRSYPEFLSNIQSAQYDLAIQMQGSGDTSNILTLLFGAEMNAGFYLPGHFCPDPNYFLPYPDHEPEIWRHLHLMEFLGFPTQGVQLEFPIYDQDYADLEKIRQQYTLHGDYVCIHPGARAPERRWPVERFASVADGLAAQGFQVILTGAEEERPLTRAVAGHMQSRPLDFAGQTNLGVLAALLSKACLLVCNDTGVSHVAAAVGTPSIVLFSASSPVRWAPLNYRLHKAIQWARMRSSREVLGYAVTHLQDIYTHAV